MSPTSQDPAITSYALAPTRTVTTAGATYAYRELGPQGGIPVVYFVHLAATLDNWDPRIIDPIAKSRHVITFDQRGVGASTGKVAPTIEEAADHAHELIAALGLETIDIFSFSMGGFIAQDLIVKHPDLVRRLVPDRDRTPGRQGHRQRRPPHGQCGTTRTQAHLRSRLCAAFWPLRSQSGEAVCPSWPAPERQRVAGARADPPGTCRERGPGGR